MISLSKFQLLMILVMHFRIFFAQDSSQRVSGLRQTNFLFIIFDDLRTELSIYGKKGMITPNFERLAAKSVMFDSFCQVAVCNPSRGSLLTGLRPDTLALYDFRTTYGSYHKVETFPLKLKTAGYRTVGIGKIHHYDIESDWDFFDSSNWYDYQNEENLFMKSEVMPDKIRPEEEFRDYKFTSQAIDQIYKLHQAIDGKYFMLALGFKMPHLEMHVPYKYYDMYRNRSSMWDLTTSDQLKFPESSPMVSWRPGFVKNYRYMNHEGELPSKEGFPLIQINDSMPHRAYKEMMWGYSAMVTFVDKQIGRILDTIDELQLWNNITIILTSDHGMNNGEKGIW